MATDVEIERALAIVTSTLNDQRLERFDPKRVQAIITASPARPSENVVRTMLKKLKRRR